MAWATQITEHVTQTTGAQCGLWTSVYSSDPGGLSWNVGVPDLNALEAFTDKLRVDDAFMQLAETGTQHLLPGSLKDQVSTIIHPAEMSDTQRMEYVAIVESTLLPGKFAEGMALGVEIAQLVERICEVRTAFMIHNTGNYGGVTWATAYANAGEWQRAEEVLNTNEEFIQLVDQRASQCYAAAPGQAVQRINRRVV
jgi:hypothetical protein